ncbi:MAG: polysaccharide biosynthesis/export family protein, partial [Armatimonadetes bacterium]|nr:polysaccharide biosynthesis/export family protein [Armatimonadota bacterium]
MRVVSWELNGVVTCAVALGLLIWASGLTGTCAAQSAVPEQQSAEEIPEQLSGDQQPEVGTEPAATLPSAEEDDQAAEFLRWERAEQDWQLPEEMSLENLRRFGEELFAGTGGEEPRTLNMPISPQYALGPGDELAVRTWSEGIEHLNTSALVSAEGTIYLPLA